MASLEDRLQHVEAQVDRLAPSLNERLDRLETAVRSAARPPAPPLLPPPPPRTYFGRIAAGFGRFVAWAGGELPKFLSAAVLLVFGWGIKDSVDLSIKQRQLDLSYAKEMQGLLQKMGEPQAQAAQLFSTAVVLASYGDAALPPLMSELRHTGLRADAAMSGLEWLTLTHPDALCPVLPRVLQNPARQFDLQAHERVVRLLAVSRCGSAVPQLRHYRQLVDDAVRERPAALGALLREAPLAPAEDYPRLLETVDETLRVLGGGAAATTSRKEPR
ncbi:MAG: hypothetical protein C0505_10955 [Leptothrix sp. (in: Bacteria)]|nr:hypothetical protein [Leptothrix sp. (in: b-proteobacteria)]